MALIKCPECGKEISDKATICIGCGFPIKEYLEEKTVNVCNENTNKKCSYCGSENVDEDGYCDDCGMKIHPVQKEKSEHKTADINNEDYTICPKCGFYNKVGVFKCIKCGHHYSMSEYIVLKSINNEFDGVYKYNLLGEKIEVYCPRCGSENCSHYQEQKMVPGKTKTRYTVNLNPLRPFTLINKKEKVVRREQVMTEDKFICNSCGKIFY